MFDVIVIALTLVIGIKGLLNGFVKEIFGLFGLIGGGIIASRNGVDVGTFFSGATCGAMNSLCELNESLRFLLGLIVVWLFVWLICLFLGDFIAKITQARGFGMADKAFGFLVGCVKVFLVFAVLCTVVSSIRLLNWWAESYFKGSFTYPALLASGKFIMNNGNIPVDSGQSSPKEENK